MIRRVIYSAVSLLLAIPAPVAGRSILGPSTERDAVISVARHLTAERDVFSRQLTLQAQSMRELVARTAPISRDAILKYHGEWESYWLASNMQNQRAGKTLEAVYAWRMNAQRARLGIPDRILVTAAEGLPTHPADLVDIASDGTILRKYQTKWGWKSAIKALQDPRYEGMGILTTRDSFSVIEQELRSAEAKAARRGLALSPEWQGVRDAIESGRLPGSWAGKQLPMAARVERYSLAHVKRYFAAGADRIAPRVTARMGQLLRTSGKVVGKAVRRR